MNANITPVMPQFNTTVWDKMDKSLTETAQALEKGAAAMKAKAGAVDAKQADVLKDAGKNWQTAGEFAWATGFLGWEGLKDGFKAGDAGARAAGNFVKGASKGGVAGAGWVVEHLGGKIAEAYVAVAMNVGSSLARLGEKFMNRSEDVAKVALDRPDLNIDQRRAAIKKALANGLADHTWSRNLLLESKEDFRVAKVRGKQAAEYIKDAAAEMVLAGAFGIGALWQVGGTCVDLAHAAALEGKELAYEAAALGQRAARVGVLAAKAGVEKGRMAEANFDEFVGRALLKAGDAMVMSAERTADIDPGAVASLKKEVEQLEAQYQQMAA